MLDCDPVQRVSLALHQSKWYIIRTKRYKEILVSNQLSKIVDDIYVPLLRAKRWYLENRIYKIEPLFPGYAFALFNPANVLYKLRRTQGVVGIVCSGEEPCEVDASTIEQIRCREKDGVIVLNQPKLQPLQRVSIVEGPFQGIEGVFERYLRGADRVAILLNSVRGGKLRVLLSRAALSPASSHLCA